MMLSEGARVLAERLGGKRGSQLALQKAFLARGRKLSEGLISHWLRGRRRPNIDNGAMLYEVLGIEPRLWSRPARKAA
jgi:hypothetical protein